MRRCQEIGRDNGRRHGDLHEKSTAGVGTRLLGRRVRRRRRDGNKANKGHGMEKSHSWLGKEEQSRLYVGDEMILYGTTKQSSSSFIVDSESELLRERMPKAIFGISCKLQRCEIEPLAIHKVLNLNLLYRLDCTRIVGIRRRVHGGVHLLAWRFCWMTDHEHEERDKLI